MIGTRRLWLSASVLMIGNLFAGVPGAWGQLKPGQTRQQTLHAEKRVGPTEGRKSDTVTHQPDPGWIVLSYKGHEKSKAGVADWNVSYVQANSRVMTSSEVKETYRSLREYTGKFGIADVVKVDVFKKLKEEEDSYIRTLSRTASTHRAVVCTVSAKGQGYGHGRSWVSVDVVITEMYVGTTRDLTYKASQWRSQIERLGQKGGASGNSSGSAVKRTEFVTNGGSRFVKGSGADWTEYRRNGPTSRFRQVANSEAGVQLYDANRKMYVLLAANRGLWRQNSSEQWRPWPTSEGRWVK